MKNTDFKNVIVIKSKAYLKNDSKKKNLNSFLLIFQGLRRLSELVVGSSPTVLSEMTPNCQLKMVTMGGVRSWSVNFLDWIRKKGNPWAWIMFTIQTHRKKCKKSWWRRSLIKGEDGQRSPIIKTIGWSSSSWQSITNGYGYWSLTIMTRGTSSIINDNDWSPSIKMFTWRQKRPKL